jgi:hypothetical protein
MKPFTLAGLIEADRNAAGQVPRARTSPANLLVNAACRQASYSRNRRTTSSWLAHIVKAEIELDNECSLILGSTNSRLSAFSRASAPSSSAPMSRL